MKICFFGIYDPDYSRNSVMLSGLRQNGVKIVECREDWRDPKRYFKLWRRLKALNNDYDCVYAAYPSSVPAVLAKILSNKPVIIDAFYSNFDSVVNDRKKYKRLDPRSLKLLFFDWIGVLVSDLVVADTKMHAKYWLSWWGMSRKKYTVAYIGVDDKVFHPTEPVDKDYVQVLFHGTFIPLQGVKKIVEAAHLCTNHRNIKFVFVGNGRDFVPAKKLAEGYQLENVEFVGAKPLADIDLFLAKSDIVMGIFGDTAKTQRVIPNKVYEGLYAKRAVITADTDAIREIFSDDQILLVKNDPRSIADGIMKLARDKGLRRTFANKGYEAVCKYKPVDIGKMFLESLRNVFDKK